MAQTIELTWLDNALENSCVLYVLAFHNDLKTILNVHSYFHSPSFSPEIYVFKN